MRLRSGSGSKAKNEASDIDGSFTSIRDVVAIGRL